MSNSRVMLWSDPYDLLPRMSELSERRAIERIPRNGVQPYAKAGDRTMTIMIFPGAPPINGKPPRFSSTRNLDAETRLRRAAALPRTARRVGVPGVERVRQLPLPVQPRRPGAAPCHCRHRDQFWSSSSRGPASGSVGGRPPGTRSDAQAPDVRRSTFATGGPSTAVSPQPRSSRIWRSP